MLQLQTVIMNFFLFFFVIRVDVSVSQVRLHVNLIFCRYIILIEIFVLLHRYFILEIYLREVNNNRISSPNISFPLFPSNSKYHFPLYLPRETRVFPLFSSFSPCKMGTYSLCFTIYYCCLVYPSGQYPVFKLSRKAGGAKKFYHRLATGKLFCYASVCVLVAT